jgi:hypothetical protein
MMATGLPFNAGGSSSGRDSQSSAFFNTPGSELLYSGVAIRTASAAYTKPSKKAIQSIKHKVKVKTHRSTRHLTLGELLTKPAAATQG